MSISVIILTLNEAENIESTISAVKEAKKFGLNDSFSVEIIVSDGGSDDGTITIAKRIADKVVLGPKGRYKQLNAGAKASNGDILLFLHADLILPKDAFIRIAHEMKNPNAIGGGFKKVWKWNPEMRISKIFKFMIYLLEIFNNWTLKLFKTFPGDNAIFVRRKAFEEINGFAPLWICEDIDFSHRLKKYTNRYSDAVHLKQKDQQYLVLISSELEASTRRFEKYGFFRTLVFWMKLYLLWRAGISRDKLNNYFNIHSTIPERKKAIFMRL